MRLARFLGNTCARALPEVPYINIAVSAAIACLLLGGVAPGALADTLPPPAPVAPPAPAGPEASQAAPAASPAAQMKSLGDERYQIGRIVVDRKARRMTLPARVHVLDKPLEYLLTTTRGMKEYETLFEADVTGTEFNLACILLGLEGDKSQEPYMQFSQKRVSGPRVEITVVTKPGERALNVSEVLFDSGPKSPEPVEWVYVGSRKRSQDEQFAADVTGTLIGFVHDPNTIIESAMGLGIGAYGSVNGNADLLPPVGYEVELSITVPDGSAEKN